MRRGDEGVGGGGGVGRLSQGLPGSSIPTQSELVASDMPQWDVRFLLCYPQWNILIIGPF